MPVDVDELARIGSGITTKPKAQKTVPSTKQTTNIQTVDDLAAIGSGEPLKKKVGSEDTSKSVLNDQSTPKTEEQQPNLTGYNSLLNPFKEAREYQPSPEATPQEKLQLAGKNIVAKQGATKKSVDIFNQSYGTDFDPQKVLSNPDDAAKFLDIYKRKVSEADFTINSRLQPQNIIASSEAAGQPLRQPTPTVIPDVELLNNANINEHLLANKVVDLSLDEGRMKGLTKNQVINNIYKRIDPKGFNRLKQAFDSRTNISTVDVLTGNNPLLKDNAKDFELLNTEKAPYEFAYNESLKRQATDMQVMGTLNNDKALLDAGNSLAAQVQTDDQIYSQYPTLNKSRIAADISKEIAEKTGQLQGSNAEGVANNLNKFRGQSDPFQTEAFKKYYNNSATRDAALEVAANPDDYISDPSFLGGIGTNISKPFKELFHSIGDITGVRDKMDRLSDAKNEELFPEITPELKGYVNKIKSAVNTTAYLTGMMALQVPGTAIGTNLGLATKGAQRLGTAMAFGIPSFDGNLKDADRWMDNDAGKAAYATLGAMINTAGGEFLELGKISKFKELQTPMLDLSNKITDKTVTQDAVNELLEKAKNPFINVLEKYGTNVGKGAATMAYFTFANGVNKMLFGGEGTTKDLVENTGTAFMDGVLGMSVLGAFGAHADLKNEKNTTYKNNIYQFATNPDAARDVIETAYQNGEYDRPTYNEKIGILNTAIAAKNSLDIAEAGNNVTLDEPQKAVYVTNRTAEGIIKKQLESPLLTEEQKGTYESQIKRLQTQRENILKGLTFNDNLEPLDKIFEAQQEYKKAYEDFNNDVVESDAEVLAAKEKLTNAFTDYQETQKPESERTKVVEPEIKPTEVVPEVKTTPENDMSGLSHADWFLKNKDKFSDEEFNRIKDNLAGTEEQKSKAVEDIIAKKDEIKSNPPEENKVSPNEDETILNEIKGKITNDIEKSQDLQYFIDKAGENPTLSEERLGKELTDKLIEKVPTEKLIANYKQIAKVDETMPAAIRLDEIIGEREKQESEKNKKPVVRVKVGTHPDIKKLEEERDAKINEVSKPKELNLLSDKELRSIKGSSDFFEKSNEKHAEIKDKHDALKSIIDCLWS